MAGARGLALKRPSAIPGFGLALGFTLTYLSLIVLIPLAALVLKSASLGFAGFWEVVTGAAHPCRAPLELPHLLVCRDGECLFRRDHRLGAGSLSLPGPAPVRRLRRSSLRAAHRRCRHRADLPLCAQWLDRQLARAARHQGRLYADRHRHRADLHRPSLRGAHRAARARGVRPRARGGLGHAWRQPAPDRVPCGAALAACRRS